MSCSTLSRFLDGGCQLRSPPAQGRRQGSRSCSAQLPPVSPSPPTCCLGAAHLQHLQAQRGGTQLPRHRQPCSNSALALLPSQAMAAWACILAHPGQLLQVGLHAMSILCPKGTGALLPADGTSPADYWGSHSLRFQVLVMTSTALRDITIWFLGLLCSSDRVSAWA